MDSSSGGKVLLKTCTKDLDGFEEDEFVFFATENSFWDFPSIVDDVKNEQYVLCEWVINFNIYFSPLFNFSRES